MLGGMYQNDLYLCFLSRITTQESKAPQCSHVTALKRVLAANLTVLLLPKCTQKEFGCGSLVHSFTCSVPRPENHARLVTAPPKRNESCNEFFAYFGGAPAPEAGNEFCNTMKQNRGCNCEECELCDWRGSYPGYPWLVVEGLCIVDADFCLSSPAVTNAPDQFCRVLVNDEAFGDPLVVSEFHTQEHLSLDSPELKL